VRWRAVPHKHNAFTCWRMLSCELVEKELHAIGVQPWQDEPKDAPRSRMHSRIKPEPFVARINFR
jgi:hypothetical protein